MRHTPRIVLALGLFALTACTRYEVVMAQTVMAPLGDTPVSAQVDLPEEIAGSSPERIAVHLVRNGSPDSLEMVPAQTVEVDKSGQARVCWIAPASARDDAPWRLVFEKPGESLQTAVEQTLRWAEVPGSHLDLVTGPPEMSPSDGQPLLRYVYASDTATTQSAWETCKPYHHVFRPGAEGFLTNGPEGLYPHHRGVFIGWNNVLFNEKRYDFWGMGATRQEHQRFLEMADGPVRARTRAVIDWKADDAVIVREEREVTAWAQPEGRMLLDFHIRLEAPSGDVVLDGDPEHGGFQFRAHNDVAEAPADGRAHYLFPQEDIDPHKTPDIPWVALSFVLDDRSYLVQHMCHPSNPRPHVYSAYRDYGRFGSFSRHALPEGEILELRYRLWISTGAVPKPEDKVLCETMRQEMQNRYQVYAQPPTASITPQRSQAGESWSRLTRRIKEGIGVNTKSDEER